MQLLIDTGRMPNGATAVTTQCPEGSVIAVSSGPSELPPGRYFVDLDGAVFSLSRRRRRARSRFVERYPDTAAREPFAIRAGRCTMTAADWVFRHAGGCVIEVPPLALPTPPPGTVLRAWVATLWRDATRRTAGPAWTGRRLIEAGSCPAISPSATSSSSASPPSTPPTPRRRAGTGAGTGGCVTAPSWPPSSSAPTRTPRPPQRRPPRRSMSSASAS